MRLFRARPVTVEAEPVGSELWRVAFPTGHVVTLPTMMLDALFEPVVDVGHGFDGEGALAVIDDVPLPFDGWCGDER